MISTIIEPTAEYIAAADDAIRGKSPKEARDIIARLMMQHAQAIKREATLFNDLELLARGVPAMNHTGCFFERYDTEGNYIGSEQIDPSAALSALASGTGTVLSEAAERKAKDTWPTQPDSKQGKGTYDSH